MEKVVISLEGGDKHRRVGWRIYEDAGDEEMRKVIETVEESLQKNFPNTPIVRRKRPRELFGERE